VVDSLGGDDGFDQRGTAGHYMKDQGLFVGNPLLLRRITPLSRGSMELEEHIDADHSRA
jgi:hypothetical protein